MNLAEWNSVANAPVLPDTVDADDPKGVDQYLLEVTRHAALVENRTNADLDPTLRVDRYKSQIDEKGTFKGQVILPVDINDIQVVI